MANRLWRAVLAVTTVMLVVGVPVLPASGEGQGAFDTREAFDAHLEAQGRRQLERPSNAALAWGESYVMMSLVAMYEATGDAAYLDELISRADEVLARRDSGMGVTDYRGRPLPGWSVGDHYSIGETRLADANGQPTLYLRTALTGYNHETGVTVTDGEDPGTFGLEIANERYNVREQFENLSMDQDAESYAVERILASASAQPFHHSRLHAEDLGSPSEGAERNPIALTTTLAPSRYLWPVHQGGIFEPMMFFARTVMEDEQLREDPHYLERAQEYISAAEKLFRVIEAIHWRENEEGEGWYELEKGAPVWMDGCDEPHNHSLTLAAAKLHLAAATGDAHWRDRAEKLARTIRNDMRHVPENDLYVWPYWWSKGKVYNGWGPEDEVSENTPAMAPRQTMEDFSHASIEIGFAYRCYRDGLVFTREDMERLANTFLHNIVRRTDEGDLTFADRVDGGEAVGRYDRGGANWPLLAEFDPAVLDIFLEIRAESPWNGYTVWMLQSANMNLIRARAATERQ